MDPDDEQIGFRITDEGWEAIRAMIDNPDDEVWQIAPPGTFELVREKLQRHDIRGG